MLTIAAAKGYLLKEALPLFKKIGLHFDQLEDSRKLFLIDRTEKVKLLLVRPWDVPTYVSQGAADLGIVGQDVILEQQANVVSLLDLQFGGCELVLAGPKKLDPSQLPQNLKVATKFPHCAESYFKNKGLKINLIKLYGAIELAPLMGLSDIICDLTATGATLREHQLSVIDTVINSSAVLITNPTSLKFKDQEIRAITETLRNQL